MSAPMADSTSLSQALATSPRSQGWALALQDAGYDGIRYKARHDPRGQLVSIALFGSDKPPRSAAKTTAVPVNLIHEAAATFAITVLPRRHSRRR